MSDEYDGHADHEESDRAHDADDALVSRLRVIEDQPLADRAPSYAQLHDELRQRLEAGDHS